MQIRKRVAAAAALMSVALTLAVAAPASAVVIESDSANRETNPPVSMDVCMSGTKDGAEFNTALGCFKKHGDKIYVKDKAADGFSVYVKWQNQLRNSDGNWRLYREGRCTSTLGWDKWGVCDKNFYEHSTSPNAKGGQGSRVRIKTCMAIKHFPDDCTNWSTWRLNNA
jgi:hypothetical protein